MQRLEPSAAAGRSQRRGARSCRDVRSQRGRGTGRATRCRSEDVPLFRSYRVCRTDSRPISTHNRSPRLAGRGMGSPARNRKNSPGHYAVDGICIALNFIRMPRPILITSGKPIRTEPRTCQFSFRNWQVTKRNYAQCASTNEMRDASIFQGFSSITFGEETSGVRKSRNLKTKNAFLPID